MIKLLRDSRVIAVAGLLVAVVVGYLLYDVSRPLATDPPGVSSSSQTAAALPAPPADSTPGAPSLTQPSVPSADRPAKTSTRPEPTEADRRIVAATLQKIHESLATAELSHAKIIEEHTSDKSRSKMIELLPLPPESAQEAYAEFDRGLKALPPNSRLLPRFKDDALSDIASFIDRPKPFKAIEVVTREGAEAGEEIYLLELQVDDHKTLLRDANGTLTFRPGVRPGQSILRDGYLGKKDEWVSKRYSHFFQETP